MKKRTFSENLKSELIYNDLTIKEFANIMRIPYTTMLSYTNNSQNIPRADIAVRFAKFLNTSVEYLVTGEEIDNNKIVKHYPTSKEILVLSPTLQKNIGELIHNILEELDKNIDEDFDIFD